MTVYLQSSEMLKSAYSKLPSIQSSELKNVKPFKQIPGPFSLPIWGTLYKYKLGFYDVLKYHKVLDHLYHKYGPLVREKIGMTPLVHVFDPDDAKTIYQNEDKMPDVVPLQETAQLYREKYDMSPGLGNVNGELWYKLRNAIRDLMLRPYDAQPFLPSVQTVADDFISHIIKIRNKGSVVENLQFELEKWTQESSGVVCFGRRLGHFRDNVKEDLIQANRDIFYLSGILKFSMPIYKYIPTPKWRKLVGAEGILVRTVKEYVEETISTIEQLIVKNRLQETNQYSFLTHLLAKKQLTKKDIIILTQSMFVDGLSTSVPTVLHSLYCLAVNKNVQEKAFKEVSSVLKKDKEITPTHLSQLPYIKAIVKETFRLYPNGTEIARILKKDLVLSGYHVPAETAVNINMGVHFKSEKYFKDPLTFKPERWMRNEDNESIHPHLLNPFGVGSRTCAGRRFAEQDMYVLLTKIIQNFELHYKGEQPMEIKYNTLLMPAKPLLIQFVSRT